LEGGCFKPKSDGDATVDPEADNEAVQAHMVALLETSQKILQNLDSLPPGEEGGEGSGDAGLGDSVSVPGAPQGGEGGGAGSGGGGGGLSPAQENFKAALLAGVESSLGSAASGQVDVERIKGGMRIQVMDQDGRSLFDLGGARLTDAGRGLLTTVAERLSSMPNKISIEGHTDALRMSGQKVTNWELSTARASAARIILNQAGVPNNRLTAVTGYADTQPLPGTDPNEPQNRRISIMVWDEGSAASRTAPSLPGPGGAEKTGQPSSGLPGAAVAPPSLPRLPTARPQAAPPPKTREQLEREMIENSMQRAATDRSTVGPPLPQSPEGE
jgi:chemotaxis protein MotB